MNRIILFTTLSFLPAITLIGTDGIVLRSTGELLPIKIDRAKLVSRANDNSQLRLTLDRNKPFPHEYSKLALSIAGKIIPFTSGGYHSPTNHTAGTAIHCSELADKIATHFHIKPVLRTHPGHQLIVQFKPEQQAYATNGSIWIQLHIRNVGSKDFTFLQGGRQRGHRDNQFAFSCEHFDRMLPDIGNPMNFGGIGSFAKIEPGKSHTVRVDLTKWFKFEKPGSYSLRGSYYLEIVNAVGDGKTIWEDIVADEFTLNIR